MATMIVNGREIEINGEKNILEVIRKAGIDLPTFCYHSELSVYGACRMCMVEDDKGRLYAACVQPPAAGMKIYTNTERLLHHRRMILELILSNHNRDCTTCEKNGSCRLQELALRLGIRDVRFTQKKTAGSVDVGPALVHDQSKCILCGDCVRMCDEIQGVGVLGFAYRGSQMTVVPAFGKKMSEVACVNCGQCAAVCPTGALTVKSDVDRVWTALHDKSKKVVVQVAPAVRVAFSEAFDQEPGTIGTGQLVAALRRIGFDRVYDTCFTADLTVQEEYHEFAERLRTDGHLPLFTSCCPAWVKFAEQFYPEYLDNISTCRSPQGMFGAIAKAYLPKELDVAREDLYVVSIMPCTAKKFEAQRHELGQNGVLDVDAVLTTQEIAQMVREANLNFDKLPAEAFDLPFGMATGAGMIFGVTGGVAEAVLRTAARAVDGKTPPVEFKAVRGLESLKEAAIKLGDQEIKVAVVHGLSQAKALIEAIKKGECSYHLVEVMACPGGCVGGGGQPLPNNAEHRELRAQGLYNIDQQRELRCSDDNPMIERLYRQYLGQPGSEKAEELLHTTYASRRRISGEEVAVEPAKDAKTKIRVCVGTSCYLKGAYDVLKSFQESIKECACSEEFDLGATFCLEHCNGGPNVQINDEYFGEMTPSKARELVQKLAVERD
ncbi:MAG TPA: 2Fe-2S iron-sulfur cluster binding domain-containing protein [Firmicutes bacterium]|nr:2Fe-2S iron-sulfur cluster binding domain-containing protein [Bacillota bacterium]